MKEKLKELSEKMFGAENLSSEEEKYVRRVNRGLVFAFGVVVLCLIPTYLISVIVMHEHTWLYFAILMTITIGPLLGSFIYYLKNPNGRFIKNIVVQSYMLFYVFVMISSHSVLVFTFVLPIIPFVVLSHKKRIVVEMAIVSFIVNIYAFVVHHLNGDVTKETMVQYEIQFILLASTFIAAFFSAKVYGEISNAHIEAAKKLDEEMKKEQSMSIESIKAIANTIDAKDPYTNGHSKRVAEYTYMICKKMDLPEEYCEKYKIIALMHDIGKIGVPDAVLTKPGRLTDEEFNEIKQHPVYGAQILKDITYIPYLGLGAKYHHERYDGRGYPDGLKGEEIPLVARIICVADSFDAMSTKRCYRDSLTLEKITDEFEFNKGKQFDPEIADIMIGFIKDLTVIPIIGKNDFD